MYQIYSNFSCGFVYEPNYMFFVQLFFNSLPVTILGAWDKDIRADTALMVPQAYRLGITQSALTWPIFLIQSFEGMYHGIAIYFTCVYSMQDISLSNGQLLDSNCFNVVTILYTMWITNISIFLNTRDWSSITIAGVLVEFALIIGYTFIVNFTPTSTGYMLGPYLFSSVTFWLTFVLATAICLVPRLAFRYMQLVLYPTDTQIVQELENSKRHLRGIASIGRWGSLIDSSRASLAYRSKPSVKSDTVTHRSSTLEITDIRHHRESFSLPRDTQSLILTDTLYLSPVSVDAHANVMRTSIKSIEMAAWGKGATI